MVLTHAADQPLMATGPPPGGPQYEYHLFSENYGGLQDHTPKPKTSTDKWLCRNCFHRKQNQQCCDPKCSDCLTQEAIDSAKVFAARVENARRKRELEQEGQERAKKQARECQQQHGTIQRLGVFLP